MELKEMENIIEFIANIKDSRQQAKIRHTVTEIIIIVLFAMLGNANEWEEIEAFAKKVHENCLREYIPLKNGIPSHGTIRRVMGMLSPESMQRLQVQ